MVSLPTAFLVDREGRIVQRHVGLLSTQRTLDEVEVLLGEERFTLQPLAARRCTSLTVGRPATTTPAPRTPRPVIPVEKRALAAYAQLRGGVA